MIFLIASEFYIVYKYKHADQWTQWKVGICLKARPQSKGDGGENRKNIATRYIKSAFPFEKHTENTPFKVQWSYISSLTVGQVDVSCFFSVNIFSDFLVVYLV